MRHRDRGVFSPMETRWIDDEGNLCRSNRSSLDRADQDLTPITVQNGEVWERNEP